MQRRQIPRIDYKSLNDTGVKKIKSNNVLDLSDKFNELKISEPTKMDNILVEIETITADIHDFFEENVVSSNHSLDDIDDIIEKINDKRTRFRRKHNELKRLCKDYNEQYGEESERMLNAIKKYISDSNDIRHKLRMKDFVMEQESKAKEERCIRFQLEEITRILNNIDQELSEDINELSDDAIQVTNADFNGFKKKLHGIASKISEVSRYENQGEVEKVMERYEHISSKMIDFEKGLRAEIMKRELDKEKLFKESKLNIKLGKFKDFNSPIDIYSFHDKFDKLYLRTTPKRLLADLLKNNHLENPALLLVNSETNIDEIWSRLKKTYGDPKIMLDKKLNQISNLESLWKSKNSEKTAENLNKIINLMRDLIKLSEKHGIESKLYNGDALTQIYKRLGDIRMTRWLESISDEVLNDRETWEKLILFLERESRIQHQKMLVWKKSNPEPATEATKSSEKSTRIHHTPSTPTENLICHICNESGHIATFGPGGIKHIQYFTCQVFVNMSPEERFDVLKKKGLCYQCLLPGACLSESKHKKGWCQKEFACQHEIHEKYPRKKHVLVCQDHRDYDENKAILKKFKERYILNQRGVVLPEFSKAINLTYLYESSSQKVKSDNPKRSAEIAEEEGIYQLQTVKIDGQRYNIFYDSGCSNFVCRKSAIERLGEKAILEYDGPVNIGGVGDMKMQAQGVYTVKLPLSNHSTAMMTGLCLEKITASFPVYPLKGEVENDIRSAYVKKGGVVENLPILPKTVGGDTDFMIGIKYLRYHPVPVFSLPSGLTIYTSCFENADGGFGVVGGPHAVFTKIERHFHSESRNFQSFLTNQLSLYRNGFSIDPDFKLLGFKSNNLQFTVSEIEAHNIHISSRIKLHEEVEETGTTISYRCIKCRNCADCKNHDSIEEISIREEIEQDVINKSVTVDATNRCTVASLPFTCNPATRLVPNRNKALRVYNQQLKKLNKNPKDKSDVIKSEAKLQSLGHVEFVKNLTLDQQRSLYENEIKNFIPWRAVWKSSSLSTPCRIVFDASQPTDSGYSLNNLLAKGQNNMNKLQDVLIRWFTHKVVYHTDVQKMYNSVKLKEEHWCYQRYLWDENLNPENQPTEKVIKTLIYGVKSSGNQAEQGLRKTAAMSSGEFPEVSNVIHKDIYVDDCLSGEENIESTKQRADELEVVLNRGGFTLKGVTFSGENPPSNLTDDGISVSVGGMKWYSKDDELSLDIGELCFAKKVRGRRNFTPDSMKIPNELTRRQCVAKVAEIFDLTGKVMPIVSGMKLDLHELIKRKLNWDDVIPHDLRRTWLTNLNTIQELKMIRFKRAVVPPDASSLKMQTIDFGDASTSMACAAIYARFQRRNGQFSSQLIFARSKIIPDGKSQPRAELISALLSTHTGEIVRRALGKYHESHIKLSDSQIVLYWIQNDEKPLKQWVRNRVIEIRRLTRVEDWYHVSSNNMLADLGTRKGATIKDVMQDSEWLNGQEWMLGDVSDMPIRSLNELELTESEIKEVKKEFPSASISCVHVNQLINKDEIQKRYEFSSYLINPNKFRFEKVIRVLALVIKFIKYLKKKPTKLTAQPLENEIKDARNYFYKKATAEVIEFNKKSSYQSFSIMKDGILYYTGRILPTDQITIAGRFTNAMKDLSQSTFFVPVIDKYSPIAYSIVNEVHWYDNVYSHCGVESVWRQVQKVAFIIEGRTIVKNLRKNCERCRYLCKKRIEVLMGPVSPYNTTIAPAFYVTQVDLAGPFNAYTPHNKRKTVKVWFTVFCCCTTSAVKLMLMEDYSSIAFTQSFIRFSCCVGYPKFLLPDAGSQLLSTCENMVFSYKDVKEKLYIDHQVEFEPCPVGAHYMHGRVERKIREVKKSIQKSFEHQRLSVIEWETVGAEISNALNDMPLAIGNISEFEMIDVLTPNRLLLGRNNDRSPIGVVKVNGSVNKFLEENRKIYESWFELWLQCHVPKLMHQPKWFNSTHEPQVGDIVLFLKRESSISSNYQYGVVHSLKPSRDGVVRKVTIKYRNSNENVFRETSRAIRELVIIHSVDDIDLMSEIENIGKYVDEKFKENISQFLKSS